MIELINITKKFGEKTVLDNINLQIEQSSIVGLYGESGAGKSTIAKILCGVLKADSGSATFNGSLLFSPNKKYDRKAGLKIQMVYQQPFSVLDPSQKIKSGLKELILYHKFTEKSRVKEFIEDLAESVELEKDILNHLPHQISGGEAQRIAIAKSLLFKPNLLILDEATSMLDVSTQANVLSMIKRKTAEYNGSILMISHDKQLTEIFCPTIYDLQNGKLLRR